MYFLKLDCWITNAIVFCRNIQQLWYRLMLTCLIIFVSKLKKYVIDAHNVESKQWGLLSQGGRGVRGRCYHTKMQKNVKIGAPIGQDYLYPPPSGFSTCVHLWYSCLNWININNLFICKSRFKFKYHY